MSQNALDTRKLRAAALGVAGAAIPLIANVGKGLGSIGKPGGAAKRDAGVEGKPRTLTDDMLAEADFAGRIPIRADLENHLINAKVSGRQISGGHNMDNFESTLQRKDGKIISKTEIASGIYEVEYTLPKGKNREPEVKTVYDPAIHSDSKIVGMAVEAAGKANIRYQTTGNKEKYIKIDDVWFYAPINVDKSTGVVNGIRTVFPRTPEGKK